MFLLVMELLKYSLLSALLGTRVLVNILTFYSCHVWYLDIGRFFILVKEKYFELKNVLEFVRHSSKDNRTSTRKNQN